MIYIAAYLYIIASMLFFVECMDDEEVSQGLQWVPPTFLWPVLIPIYLISRVFGK